jgi:hypothetical protein
VEYTRTTFIPIYSYVGRASIEIGLYSAKDQRRVRLMGLEREPRAYKVLDIELLPQSENIFLVYSNGWHRVESEESSAVEWQWTRKEATVAFRNPRRDALLYLRLDGRPDVFPGGPQNVVVTVAGQPVDAFRVDSPDLTIRKVPLTAAQFGTADMVELRLAVDKTFVPAALRTGSSDPRELGIRVFNVFLKPR